jgi:uncharacterized protein
MRVAVGDRRRYFLSTRTARTPPSLTLWNETEQHWTVLRHLLTQARLSGTQVHDARIVALCFQHGIRELWSADRDFSRFPDLKVVNPLLG